MAIGATIIVDTPVVILDRSFCTDFFTVDDKRRHPVPRNRTRHNRHDRSLLLVTKHGELNGRAAAIGGAVSRPRWHTYVIDGCRYLAVRHDTHVLH